MTKQHFGVLCTTMTYWWAPVKMRVSGDESVRGQLRQAADGRLECDFPERLVLISNHQVSNPIPCTNEQRSRSTDLHRLGLPLVDRIYL
jgi:hypothetical protein